jgi:hypothetical protein
VLRALIAQSRRLARQQSLLLLQRGIILILTDQSINTLSTFYLHLPFRSLFEQCLTQLADINSSRCQLNNITFTHVSTRAPPPPFRPPVLSPYLRYREIVGTLTSQQRHLRSHSARARKAQSQLIAHTAVELVQ